MNYGFFRSRFFLLSVLVSVSTSFRKKTPNEYADRQVEINAQRKNVDFMANRFESHNKGFLDDSDWMLKVKLLANNDYQVKMFLG